MMKQKKKTLANKEIIRKLTKAGLVPQSRYSIDINALNSAYYYNYNTYKRSYRIPISVYKEHIGKRFTTKFQLNNIVRVRSKTTRKNSRRGWGQDVGNIYTWGHLGIGSGKSYVPATAIPKRNRFGSTYNTKPVENKLTIGNEYIMNVTSAIAMEKKYTELGYQIKKDSSYRWADQIRADHFYEKVILEPTGLFGPKRLINGYITEIYVHFLDPQWEYKREARYEVRFDTGAHGIFTADMLERVFDTDFDVDERLMAGCISENCNTMNCDHTETHMWTPECDEVCPYKDAGCDSIYDFTQLHETTIQRGILEDEETEEN